jgi:hypothetical protein
VLQLRLDKRLQNFLGDGASGPGSVDAAANEQQGSGSNTKIKDESDGSGGGKATEKPGCGGLVKSGKTKSNGDIVIKEGGDISSTQMHQVLQDIQQVLCLFFSCHSSKRVTINPVLPSNLTAPLSSHHLHSSSFPRVPFAEWIQCLREQRDFAEQSKRNIDKVFFTSRLGCSNA